MAAISVYVFRKLDDTVAITSAFPDKKCGVLVGAPQLGFQAVWCEQAGVEFWEKDGFKFWFCTEHIDEAPTLGFPHDKRIVTKGMYRPLG